MSEKFKADLDALMIKLCEDLDNNTERKLEELKDKLIKLQLKNVVKINHSVMELVCAKYLILAGYYVEFYNIWTNFFVK